MSQLWLSHLGQKITLTDSKKEVEVALVNGKVLEVYLL